MCHPEPLCPSSHLGYRPPTSVCLGLLLVYKWFQVQPVFLVSPWRSCPRVFLGRPLLLFPSWFNDKLCLFVAFLIVWPIHPQLLPISSPIGCCWVICHKLMLLILSGQWILRIFLRQWGFFSLFLWCTYSFDMPLPHIKVLNSPLSWRFWSLCCENILEFHVLEL